MVPPDVACQSTTGVIFVNFHSEALILPRAASLLNEGFEVVVADNSGTFPKGRIRRLAMPGNVGFAAACNAATAALPPAVDTLCFHNPDVEAPAAVVRALLVALDLQPRPGAVAPAERVRSLVRTRGYRYPSPRREALLGTRVVLRTRCGRRPSGAGEGVVTGRSSARWVRSRPRWGRRFPSGGLLIVSRQAHDAIGGFDERYFLYGEDLDYWHRLGVAGCTTEFRPELVIDHAASTGSPIGAAQREVLRWLGIELFAETFVLGDWRRMRLAHRLLLPLIAPGCPVLAKRVARCWRAGERPSAVLSQLRPFLAGNRAPADIR